MRSSLSIDSHAHSGSLEERKMTLMTIEMFETGWYLQIYKKFIETEKEQGQEKTAGRKELMEDVQIEGRRGL